MEIKLGRMYHVNVNVRDMETSKRFYESLGFTTLYDFRLDEDTTRTTCAAFGAAPQKHRGVFMSLGDSPTATILDLVQWMEPPTSGELYPSLTNVGVCRIAFHVDNPTEIAEELARRGIALLGPIGYGNPPGGKIGQSVCFAFRDPDGNVIEILSGVDHMARPAPGRPAAAEPAMA